MGDKASAKAFLYWLGSLAFIAGAFFLILCDQLLSPAPAPPAAAVKREAAVLPKKDIPVLYREPRTEEPLGEATQSYKRYNFLVDGVEERHNLTYFLYQPQPQSEPPYPAGVKFPLVLVLHDGHGRAQGGEYLVDGDRPARFPAYIVVPVLPYGKKWALPETFDEVPGFVPLPKERAALADAAALVQALVKQYPVDKRRIYVMGCSDGGFGAFGAAARYPDLFAAAVPISSGWTTGEAAALLDVPLWVMHGGRDAVFPARLSRDAVSSIKGLGGEVLYTEFPGVGHDCGYPLFYSTGLWRWLFGQSKPAAEPGGTFNEAIKKPPAP